MTAGRDLTDTLRDIDFTLDRLRRVAAEHQIPVTIDPPADLTAFPEAPPGLIEVFSRCARLGGDWVTVAAPPEIASPDAWRRRNVNPHCPLGTPVVIGYETVDLPSDVTTGATIFLDPDDGDVYYIDADDYVFLYKHPGEQVRIEELAPDAACFVQHYLLGEAYPRLVSTLLGSRCPRLRDRRGRYRDSWMRLLSAAEIPLE